MKDRISERVVDFIMLRVYPFALVLLGISVLLAATGETRLASLSLVLAFGIVLGGAGVGLSAIAACGGLDR